MERWISWSGGKDSTASIILAYENGIKIDGIVFVEVMYDHTRNISGENPEQIKWIKEVAIPRIKELFGYEITIIKSPKDYLQLFHHVLSERSKYSGKKAGYFLQNRCVGNSRLKIEPLKDFFKNKKIEQIVGIAIDEPKRLERLRNQKNKRSLLVEFNYTEQKARELCAKYNLLSPLYEKSKRGGCWFCPNARVEDFKKFAQTYFLLWEEFVHLGDGENIVNNHFSITKTITELEKQIFVELNQITIDDILKEK